MEFRRAMKKIAMGSMHSLAANAEQNVRTKEKLVALPKWKGKSPGRASEEA